MAVRSGIRWPACAVARTELVLADVGSFSRRGFWGALPTTFGVLSYARDGTERLGQGPTHRDLGLTTSLDAGGLDASVDPDLDAAAIGVDLGGHMAPETGSNRGSSVNTVRVTPPVQRPKQPERTPVPSRSRPRRCPRRSRGFGSASPPDTPAPALSCCGPKAV